MNAKRRAAITASLLAGNRIHRQWKGANQSGYLSYQLEGVNLLRESEVEGLENDGLLVAERTKGYSSFLPLRLATLKDFDGELLQAETAKAEAQKALDAATERATKVARKIEMLKAILEGVTQ